ncbi:hypothetical protein GQX74_014999 [Glossina fuscipes]|nr:hypothetical protein GQX74_014999 [Glossina fuscipes]
MDGLKGRHDIDLIEPIDIWGSVGNEIRYVSGSLDSIKKERNLNFSISCLICIIVMLNSFVRGTMITLRHPKLRTITMQSVKVYNRGIPLLSPKADESYNKHYLSYNY